MVPLHSCNTPSTLQLQRNVPEEPPLLSVGSIAGSIGSLLQEFKTKVIAIKNKNVMGLSDFIN
jgi:hypothetical protein